MTFFETFFVPGQRICPGIFAAALVPGHWDSGTRKLFCPVPWKPFLLKDTFYRKCWPYIWFYCQYPLINYSDTRCHFNCTGCFTTLPYTKLHSAYFYQNGSASHRAWSLAWFDNYPCHYGLIGQFRLSNHETVAFV